MSWPAPSQPPMIPVTPPSSQATPLRPGRSATALRRTRSQGFWWTIASLVLAVALGCCLWFARPITPPRFVSLPPGATYVDELETAYTVLWRNEKTDDWQTVFGPKLLPEGAVFLEYFVQVDGYHRDIVSNRMLNLCTFQLVGGQGQIWNSLDIYTPELDTFCPQDAQVTSFQIHAAFMIPEHEVPTVLGLVPERIGMNPHTGTEYVFSEPR